MTRIDSLNVQMQAAEHAIADLHARGFGEQILSVNVSPLSASACINIEWDAFAALFGGWYVRRRGEHYSAMMGDVEMRAVKCLTTDVEIVTI